MEYIDGNLLRVERLKHGLSQRELAMGVGISVRSIINFEKGRAPSLLTALRLANFLDMTVEDLFPVPNMSVVLCSKDSLPNS